MAATGVPKNSRDISSISLHNIWPVAFHGYIAPFMLLYGVWLYLWVFIYGVSEYFEAGLISLAAIGILQILCCLFCYWFITFRMLVTSSKVSSTGAFHAGQCH